MTNANERFMLKMKNNLKRRATKKNSNNILKFIRQ